MPKNDDDKHEEEYAVLLALFQDLIKSIREEEGEWESLEDLMRERADIGVRHAFEGFGISYDEAMELLENADDLTDEQRVQRDILVAAVDNIVDFSVAEEYRVADKAMDVIDDFDPEEYDDPDDYEEALMEALLGVCKRYNHQYAWTENLDIEYAMTIAAYLSHIKDDTVLMYMTMGDERVRPWHLQYEGFCAPKSQFPQWLVPPIENQCRCFLVEESASSIAKVQARGYTIPEMPDWFNPVFKESVAFGGRIFSDEHPYFQIEEQHLEQLTDIANRIKERYHLNGSDTD